MSLPASLADAKEYWLFEEGTGATALGAKGELDLTCTGSWGAGGVNGLWSADGDGSRHKAAGVIPDDWELLEAVGAAVTIAVEVDFDAPSVDAYTGAAYDGTVFFAHLMGGYSALDCFHGLWEAPPYDPATNTHLYTGNGVGAGNGVDHFIGAPPYSGERYTLIIECVRVTTTDVRVRLYRGAAQVQADGVNAWDATNTDFHLGDEGNRSLIRNAAIWLRVLTSDERTAIGSEGLDGLPDAGGDGDPEGGLDGDGNSYWTFDFPATAERVPDVIASEGQRHTRQLGGRVRRRYRLRVTLASGAELERLRTVLAAARGGAGAFEWRHPIDDDLGDPAPLYRIVGGVDIVRAPGGQTWSAGLVFEEV